VVTRQRIVTQYPVTTGGYDVIDHVNIVNGLAAVLHSACFCVTADCVIVIGRRRRMTSFPVPFSICRCAVSVYSRANNVTFLEPVIA